MKKYFFIFVAIKKTNMFDKNLISEVDVFGLNTTNLPGGVIVLELNTNDYSLAQIARIVEDNDAKILSSHVASVANSFKIEVTLKINQTDLTSILQSFQRFDYTIKASFQGSNRQEDVLRKNYDQFMLYLNV
jgi:hypothetical protein